MSERKFLMDKTIGDNRVVRPDWSLCMGYELELRREAIKCEGVPVNPDGEGHREQAQAKSSRRERESPGEEGEEVKSPKRKVIRVESEETLDHVKEAMDLSQEGAEKVSFVPCAISVPPKPLFRWDNRCTEKALGFWQFASVVIKEGEKSYTTNLCQQCYNQILVARGDKPLTK